MLTKNSILVFVIIGLLQSCLVTDKSFVTKEQLANKDSFLRKNELNMSCELARGDSKFVALLLIFKNGAQQRHIKNISIKFLPNDKQKIELKDVSMSCWQQKIDYRGFAFFDIPDSLRTTGIKRDGVSYVFDFIAEHNIKAKIIEISVQIEFDKGENITINDNFILKKHLHFAMH